jgi:hypothetical protein
MLKLTLLSHGVECFIGHDTTAKVHAHGASQAHSHPFNRSGFASMNHSPGLPSVDEIQGEITRD